jgi:hypothetical protein
MKKILLMILCLTLAGCVPIDRKNPTDPQASNYKGWTYIGEIGSFGSLTDFVIASSIPFTCSVCPKQDYILCMDASDGTMSEYLVTDGTFEGKTVSMFTKPSGICVMNDFLFVVDESTANNVYAFETGNYNNNWALMLLPGDKIESVGTSIYIAVSSPAAVNVYIPDTGSKTYSAPSAWAMETANSLNAGYISRISDISKPQVNPANTLMICDPDMDRISFFTPGGVLIPGKSFDIGTDIIGAACYNNKIYVPTKDGLRIIDYVTGNTIDTIFNYGDGNGKVIKPAQIELYAPRYVLINNGTSIKYFETSGL